MWHILLNTCVQSRRVTKIRLAYLPLSSTIDCMAMNNMVSHHLMQYKPFWEAQCNKPLTGLSPTFTLTLINQNDELKNSVYFFVMSNYNLGPSRSWFKLNHPTIREKQKDPLSSPKLSFIPKPLLLLSMFTYSKDILIIALSFSSTLNLLSLVLLEPSSIFYLHLVLPIGTV